MSPAMEQLLSSALTFSESERLELAEALIAASQPPVPQPIGEAWLSELRRRSSEIDAGTATFASWDEVKQRARDRLGGTFGD